MTLEETKLALILATFRALEDGPAGDRLAAATTTAAEVGCDVAAAPDPNPVEVAAIQLLRGRIETLRGDLLASHSTEVAVLLARHVISSDLGEKLLIEALLCSAQSHRAANRLDIARQRAAEALAVAELDLEPNDPVLAGCWTELARTSEAMGDATASSAAYRAAGQVRRPGPPAGPFPDLPTG